MENMISVDKLHEECGVFGIYAPEGENVAEDIYCGLTALQHRGQESAGISVSDTGRAEINLVTKKGMGLVSEVFDKKILESLKGNAGLGTDVQRAGPLYLHGFRGLIL